MSTLELYIDGKRPPFLSMYHELPMKEGEREVKGNTIISAAVSNWR